jgi:hypothetical protein
MQYFHDRLSGKNHSLKENTLKAYRSRIGQMMDYMQKHMGIHSHHHIKEQHIVKYLSHLERRPSQKGMEGQGYRGNKESLIDRSLANHLTAIRWFAERADIKLAERNAAYGYSRNRKEDEEKPIAFPKGWLDVRAAYQVKLEKVASWVGCLAQLGLAFGLRAKERLLSNTVLTVGEVMTPEGRKTTYSLAVAGRPPVDITREQLTSKGMYKTSFGKRLDRAEPGEYLVVRFAKGGRVRLQSIYNDERRAAVERVQEACQANETAAVKDGQPPTVVPYGAFKNSITQAGEVSKTFLKRAAKFLTNLYSRLGGTIENKLHTNADRHWDTQRLYYTLRDGTDFRNNPTAQELWERTHDKSMFQFSQQDIIEERGHSDGRKIAHYTDDPLGRF